MRGLLASILELLDSEGPTSPGDAVISLGAPRYRVLSAFHCLEELGLVSALYSRGTYKIYTITERGRMLLKAAQETGGLASALDGLIRTAMSPPTMRIAEAPTAGGEAGGDA